MNIHLVNALNDPKSDFGIIPSVYLRELIAKNEHPVVQKLPERYKITFMELPDGKCVLIDRDIVRRYVMSKSTDDEKFVLDNCDIRFWKTGVPFQSKTKRQQD